MPGNKRALPPETKAKFFAGLASGMTITDASKLAGIHVNTGSRLAKKARAIELERKQTEIGVRKAVANEGGAQRKAFNDFMEAIEMPSAKPFDDLSEEAKRGIEDFGFFREYYLGRVPSPWQVDAAYKLVDLLRSEDKEYCVLNVSPGAGKALALDTLLRTPTGWTTIGDVKEGDYVCGADGQPVMVVAKSEIFYDHDCYTVTTDDGYSVVADANHLWPVRLGGYGQYRSRRVPLGTATRGPKPKSVDGISCKTTESLSKPRSKRPQLQVTQPIKGTANNLLVDPYILGVWLGDGESAGGRISAHPDDQQHYIDEFKDVGYDISRASNKYGLNIRGFKVQLRELGVLKNKHIPPEYLYASEKQRLALLQGLIDTDGHVSDRGHIEFCTTNPRLAYGVRDLVLSLGRKCSIRESRAVLYGKDCGPKWRVCFMMKDAAKLPRKRVLTRDGVRTPNRYLTVTPTESVPTQCIQVEKGLFLAGEGLLVTHNSTIMHDVAVWSIVKDRTIRILIGSVSQSMAKLYSRRIRETLERPFPFEPDPALVNKGLAQNAQGCLAIDYGRFKPSDKSGLWRAEEFIVEQIGTINSGDKEPTVRAYGIEAEFIGHRADLCLFDDVASPDNARESVARDKLLERWDNVAEARVDPGGLLAVIGQRLGSGDIYAHCLSKITYDDDFDDVYDGSDIENQADLEAIEPTKRQKYHHIVYKAYYPELDTGKESKRFNAPAWPEGPLLDPKRVPWKDLSYIKFNKPDVFAVVYQQEDLDLDSRLVNRTWVTGGRGPEGIDYPGCLDQDRVVGHVPGNLSPPVISIITVDPSPTMFWGLMWILYQPELNLYHVVDIGRQKLSAEELLGYNTTTREYSGVLEDWVNRAWDKGFPVSHVIVEVNAAQRFLLAHDFVRRWQSLHQLNILAHTTSRNKLDENLGIEALLPPLIKSGAIRLPSMRTGWQTMALTDELTKWTRDKKHGTDLVMALWFAALHSPNLSNVKLPPKQWRPSWMLR